MFETFDFEVLDEVKGDPQLRVIKTEMDDGYDQTSPVGINSRVDQAAIKCYFASWQSSEADRLEAFIGRHGSHRAFFWKKPWEATTKKWKIVSVSKVSKGNPVSGYRHDFSIELKQSFHP